MTVSDKQPRIRFAFLSRAAVVLAVLLVSLFSATASAQVFFSPFKDVTNTANWNTGEQQSAITGTTEAVTSVMPADDPTLTWAFATGDCGSETWGGITPSLETSNVQDFVNAGKYYIVSTGGSASSFDCPSSSSFPSSFIKTYYSANMLGVDFDIELGQSQAIIDDLVNSAIAGEQAYPNMRFSFTIQTLGASSVVDLNSNGALVVNEIKRLGLGGNYYVDLMAFDYGSASAPATALYRVRTAIWLNRRLRLRSP